MSAIIQRPRRITSESASKESREAVNLVGSSVNNFMEEAYIAMMGNLGVTSNLNMEIKTLNVNVASNGNVNTEVSYRTSLKTKTQGMIVIRTFDASPTATPFVSFSENAGIITISNVLGLTADTDYQLVILAIGL